MTDKEVNYRDCRALDEIEMFAMTVRKLIYRDCRALDEIEMLA